MKDSYMQRKEDIVRNWYVIDAEGKNLGRVATKAAHILRGKHKPTFTPNVDCGDYVIIVNASKVNLTGNKLDDKIYYNHSGYTGGLRERTAREMKENYPVEMIERAVKGMLKLKWFLVKEKLLLMVEMLEISFHMKLMLWI